MVKKSDVIRTVLEKYLRTEAQWCTGSFAKSRRGRLASATSTWAVSRCALGALNAAILSCNYHKMYSPSLYVGLGRVLQEQNPQYANLPIAAMNDGSGDLPSIGYQGIRQGFEKYLAELEECGE